MSRRAVFLDREGTINVRPAEHEYVVRSAQFVWLPGARDGIVRLADAGFVLTVVSNQRGVALGVVSHDVVREIEDRIQTELARFGCRVEGFRYCFHDIGEQCECRKPKPALLLGLARELDLDLPTSWMIGDMHSDVLAGKAAGCRTALIGFASARVRPDIVAASLEDASKRIATEAFVPAGS